MFRKVDAREYVVGFYSTGPKIRANDLQLEQLLRQYCEHPVFVIIDVRKDVIGVPVKAYAAVDTLQEGALVVVVVELSCLGCLLPFPLCLYTLHLTYEHFLSLGLFCSTS